MTLPPITDWQAWGKVLAAVGTIVGIGVALPKAEPYFYVSSQYLRDATNPLLVVSLQNTIEIIEAKQATIQMRIDNAAIRLRQAPNDPVVRDAWAAANQDWTGAEFRKGEVLCSLRQARGLGCGR